MGIKKGISGITSFLIWIAIFTLAVCLLGAYINPAQIPVFGIFSLLIGPLIIINILLLLYCILRKKRTGFGVLIILLLSTPQILNLWGFHIKSPNAVDPTQTQLKILTYNVRNFDLYNWSHNEASKETIFTVLEEVDADIICFQEFYSARGGEWDNIKRLKEELGYKHYYFSRELIKEEGRQWGIATFSKFPITNYGELLKTARKNETDKTYHKAAFTDIESPIGKIRVLNMHLASIYFDNSDYSTIGHLSDTEGLSIEKSKPIISKLLKGFERRGNQVKELNQFLKEETTSHPIILCGDFNDNPTSYSYNQLSKNLQDGFLKTSWGLGATYNGIIPGLRIDFTLLDKKFKIHSSEKVDLDISDHIPILTTFSLID